MLSPMTLPAFRPRPVIAIIAMVALYVSVLRAAGLGWGWVAALLVVAALFTALVQWAYRGMYDDPWDDDDPAAPPAADADAHTGRR